MKKYSKNRILPSNIILLMSMLMTMGNLCSCTDQFGDVEINLISGSSDSVADIETAKGMMLKAMPLIHDLREHQYQYQWNLHIDNYAGYLCVANNLEGRLPSTYYLNSDFESGPISNFLWVVRQVVPVMNSAETLKFPEIGAIANIIFCYAAQEYTDVHGPMPYFDYRKLQEDPPMNYVPVKDIYYDILEQLKTAVDVLNNANITTEQQEAITFFDKICGGKTSNWIKFANTLRLRIAMHMKKADPGKAQAEAEAAVRAGVLTAADKDIEYAIPTGDHNPIFSICDSWNDTRLNANFEMILKRSKSDLLKVWFAANNAPLEDKNGQLILDEPFQEFVGIRSGTTVFNKNDNLKAYVLFSKVNANFATHAIPIMKSIEAIFLRAEGALYNWDMGGNPKQFYEEGIRVSYQREMQGVEDAGFIDLYYRRYLNLKNPENVTYIDYYDRDNDYDNEAYLLQVGNEWDEGDTNERKLERIITQKYIANYPMSLESWTDIRRTGYPRQMPVVYDAGDHSTHGGIIRRIPFQLDGSVTPDDVFATGIPALGGDGDYQGTRLWWDVDITNF
jgi:hypothetical protein